MGIKPTSFKDDIKTGLQSLDTISTSRMLLVHATLRFVSERIIETWNIKAAVRLIIPPLMSWNLESDDILMNREARVNALLNQT